MMKLASFILNIWKNTKIQETDIFYTLQRNIFLLLMSRLVYLPITLNCSINNKIIIKIIISISLMSSTKAWAYSAYKHEAWQYEAESNVLKFLPKWEQLCATRKFQK